MTGMLRPGRILIITLVSASLVSSCTPTATTTAAVPSPYTINTSPGEVAQAKARWEAQGITRYRLKIVQGQPLLPTKYYVLEVEDGEVTRAWEGGVGHEPWIPSDIGAQFDLEAMMPVGEVSRFEGLTVEALLAEVKLLAAGGSRPCPTSITIYFDSQWSYPRAVIESWDPQCATDSPLITEVLAFESLESSSE
jgi:hypothetical protein